MLAGHRLLQPELKSIPAIIYYINHVRTGLTLIS
jgi:hypothetical protein